MTITGCTQPQDVVTVEPATFFITVGPVTNTVDAPAAGPRPAVAATADWSPWSIRATCNGTTHAGCGNLAATANVGHIPFGAAVDDQTHTMYVSNDALGELPGAVSVINTATCTAPSPSGSPRAFAMQ
jgi:DNA-binding beta-propeller fold protein YncE